MTEKPIEKPKLELVDPPPVVSIFDDLDKLRKESVIKVQRKAVKGAVDVERPKNNIFFRCHETMFYDAGLVLVGPDGSDDFYFIDPAMKDYWAVKPHIRKVTIAVVYTWPGGAISLWPVPQAIDGEFKVKCWKTAYEAYELSKNVWVQMLWNDSKSDYDVINAEEITTDPLWPSDLNLGNLMKIGFADIRTIATAEHPYVKQLRGIAT